MNRATFFLTIISILSAQLLVAQEGKEPILLSGLVVAGDSLHKIANTNIIVKNKNKGTASNQDGYFSFYAEPNDSVVFSAIGYKDGLYVVPEELDRDHYSIVQIMTNDTIWLQETIIFPWRSYDDFGDELITMVPPVTDDERAQFNLDNAQLYEKSAKIHMDGSANFKHSMQQYADRMYFASQVPPMEIFNIFAWTEFIKSFKSGAYKKK